MSDLATTLGGRRARPSIACGLSGRPNSNTGGRPQHYGTQWLEDPIDGRIRPWKLAAPERVNELRAEAGLEPMHPIPERGPALSPEQQQEIYENQRWWENWLVSKGWRLWRLFC